MLALLMLLTLGLLTASSSRDEPDYSSRKYWAALPDMKDQADVVPRKSNLRNQQDSAKVDVFYIHPTTFYRRFRNNANIRDRSVNRFTDRTVIRHQASIFNSSGRVYAPRYRQAALFNFLKTENDNSKQAINRAYKDVKKAFEYYMENYNQGRPLIIAAHSQGSLHAVRLIKEFLDGTELGQSLVAAYLIGYNIPNNTFENIPVCREPGSTGCVVSYNSFGANTKVDLSDFRGSICVNPLSWKADEEVAPASEHLGGVAKKFDELDKNLLNCRCSNGVLLISNLRNRSYTPLIGKNFHLHDYALFYMNIRENAEQRVDAFLKNSD